MSGDVDVAYSAGRRKGTSAPYQRATSAISSESVETTTSAARDVAAGRRSELDALLGAVLRAAERLDVPCPTLTELATAAGLR